MSLRIDSTEWIPGALVIGDTGGGVLAESIPSTGTDGAPYAYNDLSLPADNGKEICGRITSWPSAGTLTAYEDTSFTFTGAPDGSYTFEYQLYVDYVAVGSPATATLNVGDQSVAGTIGWTEPDDSVEIAARSEVTEPTRAGFEMVDFEPAYKRKARLKQEAIEIQAKNKKARKRAELIEKLAAREALSNKTPQQIEVRIKSLLEEWIETAPTIDARPAQEVPQDTAYEAFLQQVAAHMRRIEEDEEDAITLLLM